MTPSASGTAPSTCSTCRSPAPVLDGIFEGNLQEGREVGDVLEVVGGIEGLVLSIFAAACPSFFLSSRQCSVKSSALWMSFCCVDLSPQQSRRIRVSPSFRKYSPAAHRRSPRSYFVRPRRRLVSLRRVGRASRWMRALPRKSLGFMHIWSSSGWTVVAILSLV